MLSMAERTRTMYRRSFRVKMTPNDPTCTAINLSSIDENPKYELSFTSFRHFAHLCIAVFVSDTKNGISISAKNPKISIANRVNRYPNSDGLYSTIEFDTASQNGHLILTDLPLVKHKRQEICLLLFVKVHIVLVLMVDEEVGRWRDLRVRDHRGSL